MYVNKIARQNIMCLIEYLCDEIGILKVAVLMMSQRVMGTYGAQATGNQ